MARSISESGGPQRHGIASYHALGTGALSASGLTGLERCGWVVDLVSVSAPFQSAQILVGKIQADDHHENVRKSLAARRDLSGH